MPNSVSRFQFKFSSAPILFILGVSVAIPAGCDRDPMVRVYEVEVRKPSPTTTSNAAVSSELTPKRMLGAVIPAGERSIFLKMTGSPEAMEKYLSDLRQLATSTKLDGEDVKVSLPEGWSKGPGTSIAAFTIIPPSMDGVDAAMTVTVLPGATELNAWNDYVQQNLDRWRGQLGLPSVPLADDLQESVEAITVDGFDLPVYLVNYLGQSSGKPSMPPFAGGAMSGSGASSGSNSPTTPSTPAVASSNPSNTNAAPNEEDKPTIRFELPEGWVDKTGKGSPIRLATLLTSADVDAGEVSVVMAGGEEKTIVELWAQSIIPQSELGPEFVDEVIAAATDIQCGAKINGKFYRIAPKDTAPADSQSILVAVFPVDETDGQRSLFVKLTGKSAVVQSNQTKFEGFVHSLNWQF